MKKNGRLNFYRAYEHAAQDWRMQIHQSCRQLLHTLTTNADQAELNTGELQLWSDNAG